jgi:multidrug resistance protein MdtO
MSSQDPALPLLSSSSTLDEAGSWFWQFLKTELAPYPGRAWQVGRITIAATLVMVLVMTFRIPYGFLGAINTLFLTRENPTATLRSGIRSVVVYAVATVYTIVGIMTMVDDPLTHFLWITTSLFVAFYLIRIIPDYFTAVGFGFSLAAAIPLWDQNLLTVNARTENTLWIGFSVVVGTAVTVAVEYVFRRMHPIMDLTLAIESRLQAVEDVLRQTATDIPVGDNLEKEISLYSALGTSRIRRLLLRSGYPATLSAQINVAITLLGHLVDLAGSLCIVRSTQSITLRAEDRHRCLRLANEISNLRRRLQERQLPQEISIASQPELSELPLLPEMERTVALIPHAFSGTESLDELFLPMPLDIEVRSRLLVPDAFSNVDHLKFAVRGTLATMLAYVVYRAIDWPGLSTSVATCIITALSTIGASRQKQFLRLGGAIIGGFGFGMGAQVFVLPHLDSIVGFTVLFAVVTAIAAWIATATPRLSYLGVQLALAFYLINLQEFAAQFSLSIARDRVVGVLLGLFCMWLVFDRLWVRDALQEMQDAFCRSLRMLAELFEPFPTDNREEAAKRVLQLRDQINGGFNVVKAQGDAVLFEFGPSRQRKLRIRDDFRRWQPTLGVLLQVQVTFLQYLSEKRFPELRAKIAEAQKAFEKDMATIVRTMSDEVSGKVSGTTPDIQESAAALRQEIHNHYTQSGLPIPPPLADMITLTQNLASIVAPLHRDIHTTFTIPEHAAMHYPQTRGPIKRQ